MKLRLSHAVALGAVSLALALGACGKRGTLERPPPHAGDKIAAADKENTEAAPEPKATSSRYGPRPQAPESKNTSIRAQPIDGAPRDPRAGPGQATDFSHPH